MKKIMIIYALSFGMMMSCNKDSNESKVISPSSSILENPVIEEPIHFSYVEATSISVGYQEVPVPSDYEHIFDLGVYPGVEPHLFVHPTKDRVMAYKFPSAGVAKQAAEDQSCRGKYYQNDQAQECCAEGGNTCKLVLDDKGKIIIVCCD